MKRKVCMQKLAEKFDEFYKYPQSIYPIFILIKYSFTHMYNGSSIGNASDYRLGGFRLKSYRGTNFVLVCFKKKPYKNNFNAIKRQ